MPRGALVTVTRKPLAGRRSAGDPAADIASGAPSPDEALVHLHARVAARAPIADPLRRAARAAVAELRAGRQRPMLHWTPQVDSNRPRRRLRQKRAPSRALRLTP